MVEDTFEQYSDDPDRFTELLSEAEAPLYPNCSKFTKLSALISLWNLKAKNCWSDTSFNGLLEVLRDMLPENNLIPETVYKAKTTLKALGMEYEKIHACPNDCILYRKEYVNATKCPTCNTSRWEKAKDNSDRVNVPAKVMWYFPPISRFKRMYKSKNIVNDLMWHHSMRVKDGRLRHPADSPAWAEVDTLWPAFKAEPRNLRLAISADGVNPHGNLSSRHSCWPVLMVIYNLPPSLCMKRKFMMLTTLISGPKQPGNDIDVYLAPLIDDLKLLWEGVPDVYDAHRQETFTLKAVLLWTINDFPAYGTLAGCPTHGYHACPICGEETDSIRLKHGSKNIYPHCRRWLEIDHPWRDKKRQFDNKIERRGPPEIQTGRQIWNRVKNMPPIWGKEPSTGKRRKQTEEEQTEEDTYWKKRSIFFELEYWSHLLIRHNLDVMHTEKNVLESILNTLLSVKDKSKDGLQSRLDLVDLNIRKDLHPTQTATGRTKLPRPCFGLSREEKKRLCQTLHDLKVPDGFSSNISRCVSMKDLKLYGLKSHDCHVLMQHLLPVAIRNILPKEVRYAIIRLCCFFKALCSKVFDPDELGSLQREVVQTLCLLERFFMPSFFDPMVHITLHLVREVQLCGPVHFRWMYPFERLEPFVNYIPFLIISLGFLTLNIFPLEI
jgi:ssDNA-binding Zn-finger/Zn-ribbon topoisomerase 1